MATKNTVFVPTSGMLGILDEAVEITSAEQIITGDDVQQVGLIGEDGLTITKDVSKEEIRAFQYGAVAREVITESSLTITVPLIEDNDFTRELYFAAKEDSEGRTQWDLSKLTGGRVIFDVFDSSFGAVAGGTKVSRERWVLENATVEGTGDITYVFGEAKILELTITAQVDTETGVSASIWRTVQDAGEEEEGGAEG